MRHKNTDRHIIASLIKGLDWFDNSLQNLFAARGYQSVHRTHSMMVVLIASGINRPADIARELGVSRQNIHYMARQLIEGGVLCQLSDTSDARGAIYAFADESQERRDFAMAALARLEEVLMHRIGTEQVKNLRHVLSLDWGPEVESLTDEDLPGRT